MTNISSPIDKNDPESGQLNGEESTDLLEKSENKTVTGSVNSVHIVNNESQPEQTKHNEKQYLASALGSISTLKSITQNSIKARTVLWYLAFFGFAVNYMLRINMNIAIIDMIAARKVTKTSQQSECYNHSMNNDFTPQLNETNVSNSFANDGYVVDNLNNVTMLTRNNNSFLNTNFTKSGETSKKGYSAERYLLDILQVDYDKNGFHWNEEQQSRVLGAFFWINWILQIPGGILAKRYGTKLVFGLSNFVGCSICFFIPIAAYTSVNILIFLRILQGLITGMAWPSMHHMTAQWIPPNERSKFVSSYLGSSVGIAVFYSIFGYVISKLCWEWVFYMSGIIGVIWYIGWVYYVYDTPAQHPRIDLDERIYIEKSLAGSVKQDEKHAIPWAKILTSRPVWINILSQWGGVWGLFTLMTQAPTYFKVIHGWDVQTTGLICGIPHFLRMAFAYVFSLLGDSMLKKNTMSRTNVRKLAGFMCTIVKGIFVLGLAYSGCNSMAAILFITLATAVHGAVSTGPLANIIDLSPNFSGVILGLGGMIVVWPGFISPYIVGKLTLGNQTVQQWQYVFLITAVMLFISGILYILFADSNLQSWNQIDKDEDNGKELDNLISTKSYNTDIKSSENGKGDSNKNGTKKEVNNLNQ